MKIFFEEIYNSVIKNLVYHKNISLQDLHILVNKEYKISLSQFYKIIEKLQKQRVINKIEGKLSLHTRRILGIMDFSEEIKNRYNHELSDITLLKEGDSMLYEASSLEGLDKVWVDRQFTINSKYNNLESTYMYHSHPYYMLKDISLEESLVKQATVLSDLYCLFGNDTYLDIYASKLYEKAGAKKSVTNNKVPLLKEGYLIVVIGDFVFESLYPIEITNYFKIFFDNIIDYKLFKSDLFKQIFNIKSNCKLTLRRDKSHANTIRNIFHKIYNIETLK